MSKPAIVCRRSDSVNTAARIMWERDVGALPVVDETNAVIGVITDRDICMAAYTKGRRLADISIAEVCKGEIFSVGPRETIQNAETIMRQHQVRRLPVIDEHRHVLGMLSLNDIAREGQVERTQKSQEIGSDEVLQTLAAISQPTPRRARPSA